MTSSATSRHLLDEAETTGGFHLSVQTHDDPLDFSDFRENGMNLLFCRVKTQVPNIHGFRLGDELLKFFVCPLRPRRKGKLIA
jgi:hypothetical protein